MKRTANRGQTAALPMPVSGDRGAVGLRLACLTLAMLAAPAADAQIYRWIDPDTGMTIISNNPPPASIRPQEVRKTPELASGAPADANAKIAAEAGSATKPPAAESKPVNPCQRARQNVALLESGQPVSAPNAKGEPVVLDDAARAAELGRVREYLRSNC